MRPSPFILRTTLALSFALLLIPAASNAQLLFGGRPCTAGNGLYSCDFKDETGTQIFTASIICVWVNRLLLPLFQIRIVLRIFLRPILPVRAG